MIKAIWHGRDLAGALHQLLSNRGTDELLVRNLVVCSALIPFFAFREMRRILGEAAWFNLFFRSNLERGSLPTTNSQSGAHA